MINWKELLFLTSGLLALLLLVSAPGSAQVDVEVNPCDSAQRDLGLSQDSTIPALIKAGRLKDVGDDFAACAETFAVTSVPHIDPRACEAYLSSGDAFIEAAEIYKTRRLPWDDDGTITERNKLEAYLRAWDEYGHADPPLCEGANGEAALRDEKAVKRDLKELDWQKLRLYFKSW